jgi:hypothetical protein
VGIVASGISTVDALAVGPLAYKGRHPIFLTRAAALPASTLAAMRHRRHVGLHRRWRGGRQRRRPYAAHRCGHHRRGPPGGQTRSGTSVAIANAIIGGTFGFTNTTFNVASGANDGVDALSGAALSGQQNRALLVTDTATSAGAVTAFATARAATLNEAGIIFGGPAALSVAVETAIEAAGGATTSNQAFVTTLTGTSTVELGGDAASRTRTFSVAVPAGTAVDIQLFQAANVIRNANGTVSFVDADGDNRADPGTPVTNGATLSGVNGVPGGAANGVVSNGTVTFTVTGGTAQDSVVPVIFADTNNDDRLNLVAPATGTTTTPKLPSEPFAVGDTITFVPAAAALGASTPTVSSANVDQDFFIGTTGTGSTAASFTYRYDANDVFQFQGVAVTLAQFESIISAGDALAVSFSPAATGVSTFNILTNVGGAAPAAPTATAANVDAGATVNDVRVSYTRPENNSAGVVYTLQRATVAAGPDGTSGNSDDVTGTFTTVTTATQAAGTATREFVFTT